MKAKYLMSTRAYISTTAKPNTSCPAPVDFSMRLCCCHDLRLHHQTFRGTYENGLARMAINANLPIVSFLASWSGLWWGRLLYGSDRRIPETLGRVIEHVIVSNPMLNP